MNNFILSCKNISLTLNQVPIIENINFSLYPGEFHLLMGENGLVKLLLQIFFQEFTLSNLIPEPLYLTNRSFA